MPLIHAEVLRKHHLLKPPLLHDPSQVLYLPFDKDDGAYARDRSGHKNHGTIYGATPIAGKVGSALSFNGVDNYILAPNIQVNHITTLAWIKRDLMGVNHTISACGYWSGERQWHFFVDNANELQLRISFDGINWQTVYSYHSIPTAWTHVAAVYDGTQMRLYINGVQEPNVTNVTGTIFKSSAVSYVGCRINLPPQDPTWFKGIVDEVRIFNRALSLAEIVRLMNMRGI